MRNVTRSLIVMLSALPALGWLLWLVAAAQIAPARAAVLPSLTATPSPTPAVFTATLDVTPDRQYVLLGQTLLVTLSLTVSDGCQYGVIEATLAQSGHNLPAFAYIDPITATVGAPVLMPFSYTLQAIAPGYVTLDGLLFGEQSCGNGFQWATIRGTSPSIKVREWPFQIRLPVVGSSAGGTMTRNGGRDG